MPVNPVLIYHKGTTAACAQAAAVLSDAGLKLVDHPTPEVTHLLLDVPSFASEGALRGGGTIREVLERLPQGHGNRREAEPSGLTGTPGH